MQTPFIDFRNSPTTFSRGFQFEYPFCKIDGHRAFIHMTYTVQAEGNLVDVWSWIFFTKNDLHYRTDYNQLLSGVLIDLPEGGAEFTHEEMFQYIAASLVQSSEFHASVITACEHQGYTATYAEREDGFYTVEFIHDLTLRYPKDKLKAIVPSIGKDELELHVAFGINEDCARILYTLYAQYKHTATRLFLLEDSIDIDYNGLDASSTPKTISKILERLTKRSRKIHSTLQSEIHLLRSATELRQLFEEAHPEHAGNLLEFEAEKGEQVVKIIVGADGTPTVFAPAGLDDVGLEATSAFLDFWASLMESRDTEDETD